MPKPTAARPRYTLTPMGAGLTFSPLGASATLPVRALDYPPTVRLLTAFGVGQGLTPLGGLYGSSRYELDGDASGNATTYSVQAGVWPYDPHRLGRRAAAYGFKGGVQVVSARQPRRTDARLELGLIGLGAAPLQFGSRGELAVLDGLADRWGYGVSGWRAALSGVWSATGAAPSLGLRAGGSLTGRLGGLPLELGARFGYRPLWPVPLSDTGELGVLGTAGTRVTLPTRLAVGDGLVDVRRITVEPRLRGWLDTSLGVGADVTMSLDTLVAKNRAVSVGVTAGHAAGWWYGLSLRVQP